MAGIQQTTATAAATPGASDASGATATNPTTDVTLDPFEAALVADLGAGEGTGDGGQNGAPTDISNGQGTEPGSSSTAGDGQGNGEGKGTEASQVEELPEEINPETPPKGLENVPKAVWKRIQKQSETIRELKAKAEESSVIQVTPTALSPLAHIQSADALKQEIALAKNVRNLLGGIKPEDFGEHGKAEVTVGNQKFEFSQEEVQAKLAQADSVLDPDALTERHAYITHRETHKPWEVAEQVMSGVTKKGTPENQAYQHLVQLCPELVTRLPDHEFIIACAVRGLKQYKDEASGKVRYLRMDLDDQGKVIPPKAADTPPGGAPAKPNPVPSAQRPPVSGSGAKPSVQQVLAAKQGASAEERLDAAIGAEMDLI